MGTDEDVEKYCLSPRCHLSSSAFICGEFNRKALIMNSYASCLAILCAAALWLSAANAQETPGADLSRYILTPPAPTTPRINGPKVYGQRPGRPFLYTIPATGDRPMSFSANGLPDGVRLDEQTGRITGKVEQAGEFKVTLRAKNANGESTLPFRIVI